MLVEQLEVLLRCFEWIIQCNIKAISGAVNSAAAGDLLGAATQALKATEAATGVIAAIGQDAATIANNIKSFASISNANLAQYITQQEDIKIKHL